MESAPLVSVVTVCLNSARTIEQTFKSVLAQSYRPLEYGVVDGVSTDGTVDLIKQYEPKFREAGIGFSWLSEKDKGLYDAMNKGIARSSGKLVGIINSDDWYEPEAVELAAAAFAKEPETVIYGMLRIWRGEQEYCVRQFHHNFLSEQVTQHPTCFVPKALYERQGVFSEKYKYCADFELLNRFRKNGVGFTKVDRVMANFRIGGFGFSNSHKAIFEKLEIKCDLGLISEAAYRKLRLKHQLLYPLKKYSIIK